VGHNLFVKKDVPILEHRAKAHSTLTWTTIPKSSTCRADFHIKLENIGVAGFDVKLTRVRGWQFPNEKLDKTEEFKYLDVNNVFDVEPVYDEMFEDTPKKLQWVPFVQHYPPGTSWEQSLEFLISKKPETWTVFLIQFFEPNKTTEDDPLDATYAWDPTCGDSK